MATNYTYPYVQYPQLIRNVPIGRAGVTLNDITDMRQRFQDWLDEGGREKITGAKDWLQEGGAEKIKDWYQGGGKEQIDKARDWLNEGGREKIQDWYQGGGKEKLQNLGQWYQGGGKEKVAASLNALKRLHDRWKARTGQSESDVVETPASDEPVIDREPVNIPPGPRPGTDTGTTTQTPQYATVDTPFGKAVSVPGKGFVLEKDLTDADLALLERYGLAPPAPPGSTPAGNASLRADYERYLANYPNYPDMPEGMSTGLHIPRPMTFEEFVAWSLGDKNWFNPAPPGNEWKWATGPEPAAPYTPDQVLARNLNQGNNPALPSSGDEAKHQRSLNQSNNPPWSRGGTINPVQNALTNARNVRIPKNVRTKAKISTLNNIIDTMKGL